MEQQRHAFVSNVCHLKDLSWCRFCVILLVWKLNFLFYIFILCWAFHWVPKPLVVDGCKFSKVMKKMDVATANHDQVCSLKLVNDVFFECRLASQTHRSYSRIFYPPNSAKLNKSFKILFTKDYGLLPYSKELLNIHYLLLLSTLPCPLRRQKLTYIFYSLICWSEANCITFFAGIKGK